MKNIIEKLRETGDLADAELFALLTTVEEDAEKELFAAAREAKEKVYGRKIYIRGLIEVSSYCKNNCYYCGIRSGNRRAERYRLDAETILSCCDMGYDAGFRTFVLQGGEDRCFGDEMLVPLLGEIKKRYPDVAVTLSLGERSRESYERLFAAGADRYLLRHETANAAHYGKLHPEEMSFVRRMECLKDLKDIGYQVGCGMMVGSPHQEIGHLIEDLRFLQEFRPHMVGIGPFLPHQDTPFGDQPGGSGALTLRLLAIVRLMMPHVLLPATTALATAENDGREQGILAGANVVMPNLSPVDVRKKYMLYDNKRSFGSEAAECLDQLRTSMAKIGYEVVQDRGDYID